MALTFKIGGIEYVQLIKSKGLKWSRNDIDDGAERTLNDALMQRNRIAIKEKLEVQLKPLTASELASICASIETEYITIGYLSPRTNTVVTKEFYGSTIVAAVAYEENGIVHYDDCSFNIIER